MQMEAPFFWEKFYCQQDENIIKVSDTYIDIVIDRLIV